MVLEKALILKGLNLQNSKYDVKKLSPYVKTVIKIPSVSVLLIKHVQ